jgi:hypothetical protein
MQRTARSILILTTALWGLAMAPGGMAAMMAPAALNAPGSDRELWPKVFFAACVTLPATMLMAAVLPWFAYRRGRYWLALSLTVLPFINGVAFLFSLGMGT